MLGGVGADGNPVFPAGFVEENRPPFDHNTLSQLQLFGHAPIHCVGPTNLANNLHASGHNVAIKRVGDRVPVSTKQKLHLSSNQNNIPDESGHFGTLPNPNSVSTGLRLSFEEEEHNSSVTSVSESMKIAIPGIPGNCLKMVIDQQTEEFERYIKHQEENIVKGVVELNQRHTISLLNALEKGVARKLHEKAIEIDNINRKNQELGDKIKQVSMEAQSWHYRAKYSESMVNVLKCNIQQLMAQGASPAREGSGDSEVDDAMSGTNNPQGIVSGSGSQDPRNGRLICRSCKSKEVSFLLLPCRHLCLCTDCEGFTGICPICQVMKTASVHVYM